MANRYNGSLHKYGLVLGSFFDSVISFFASSFFFKEHIVFGFAALSFSVYSFILGLYCMNFGGRIKYSLKKKPSDNPDLYNILSKLLWVSLLIFLIFLITSIVLILNKLINK